MNINEIHFIREILVTNYLGTAVRTMQTSEANPSSLHPHLRDVAFYDVAAVTKLYAELGGGRREGAEFGSTVILPTRSRWANLSRITSADVRIIPAPDAVSGINEPDARSEPVNSKIR